MASPVTVPGPTWAAMFKLMCKARGATSKLVSENFTELQATRIISRMITWIYHRKNKDMGYVLCSSTYKYFELTDLAKEFLGSLFALIDPFLADHLSGHELSMDIRTHWAVLALRAVAEFPVTKDKASIVKVAPKDLHNYKILRECVSELVYDDPNMVPQCTDCIWVFVPVFGWLDRPTIVTPPIRCRAPPNYARVPANTPAPTDLHISGQSTDFELERQLPKADQSAGAGDDPQSPAPSPDTDGMLELMALWARDSDELERQLPKADQSAGAGDDPQSPPSAYMLDLMARLAHNPNAI